jgi:adenylyltransferase/sulfurtransferase
VTQPLQLDPSGDEDRFARFRLISWWDQEKLSRARALVIGAGALGNEILKNLALLGVGNVFVTDLDVVANSNLSRSVLYRGADCGRPKVEVAAERTRDLYPEIRVQPFHGNAIYDLGLGLFRWADVILGGLDNREAGWQSIWPPPGPARSGSTAPSSASTAWPASSTRRPARVMNAP